MTRHAAFAIELGGHHDRIPVAAVALQRDVIAGQALVCAAARARVGNQVAMVTTNAVRCP